MRSKVFKRCKINVLLTISFRGAGIGGYGVSAPPLTLLEIMLTLWGRGRLNLHTLSTMAPTFYGLPTPFGIIYQLNIG